MTDRARQARHPVPCGSALLGDGRLFAIAGPDVLESRETALETARALARVSRHLDLPLVFKSSYLKANRSAHGSYAGPGLEPGLDILAEVKSETGLPVLTDIHSIEEVDRAAEVADVLQIPAFLSRQTFLIQAVAGTGRAVNLKKGQFLAPDDVRLAIEKVTATGNEKVLVTERGTTFGYHDLVVDMRSLGRMRAYGRPVVFDATHSVQLPSAGDGESGGERELVPLLARAAVAAGVDGVFLETHPDPATARCDAASQWPLDAFEELMRTLLALHAVARSARDAG